MFRRCPSVGIHVTSIVGLIALWLAPSGFSQDGGRRGGPGGTPGRVEGAAAVLSEMLAAPDRGIPRDLIEKAQCIIIVPGLKKAGFVFGADYGRGFAVCRRASGWSAPAAVTLGGGSFGPQIGVESTDVVMLVMDRKGMEKLVSDKFTVGADASVAAGPVGRTTAADTDASLHAEVLSWSRARGVFAGVSLEGAVIKKDGVADHELYGSDVSTKSILFGEVPSPADARRLTAELEKFPSERR
jgi:SH3 domain-containing YSC84-like protein 1